MRGIYAKSLQIMLLPIQILEFLEVPGGDEIERRVTSRYHGSKIFGSQQEGASATTRATATKNGEIILHVHRAFLYIS